jgi:hypothetical protein
MKETPMETQSKNRLARLIAKEVKAQMKRYAMAKGREAYSDSLVDELAPAIAHHYRALLGSLNKSPDQVEKCQE